VIIASSSGLTTVSDGHTLKAVALQIIADTNGEDCDGDNCVVNCNNDGNVICSPLLFLSPVRL